MVKKQKNLSSIFTKVTSIEKKLKKLEKTASILDKYIELNQKKINQNDESIKTLGERIEFIKKEFGEARKQIENSVRDRFSESKKDIKEYFEKNISLINERIDDIQEELEEFNKKIIGATEVVNENIFEFDKKLEQRLIDFNELKVDKSLFESTVSSLNSSMTEINELIDNMRKEILYLFETFNNKVDIINEDLGKKLQTSTDFLEEKIAANILDVNSGIKDLESKFEVKIEKTEYEFDNKISKLGQDLIAKMDDNTGYLNNMVNLVQSRMDSIERSYTAKLNEMEKHISDFSDSLKNQTENTLRINQSETLARLNDMKKYLEEKIISFQTELDTLNDEYKNIINLNKSFSSNVAAFDKRLSEINDKIYIRMNELKSLMEEKIKTIQDLNQQRIDDLSGFVDTKIASFESQLKQINEEKLEKRSTLESRVGNIEFKLNSLADENKVMQENILNIIKHYSKIKEEINRKTDLISSDLKKDVSLIQDNVERKINDLTSQNMSDIKSELDKFEQKINDVYSKTIHQNVEMQKKINDLSTFVATLSSSIENKLKERSKEDVFEKEQIKDKVYYLMDKLKKFEDISRTYSKADDMLQDFKEIQEIVFKLQNQIDLIEKERSENNEKLSRLTKYFESFNSITVKRDDFEKSAKKIDMIEDKLNDIIAQINNLSLKIMENEKKVESIESFKSSKFEKQVSEIKALKDMAEQLLEKTRHEVNNLKKEIEIKKAKEEMEEEVFFKALMEKIKNEK
ncbi:MAG: hypothetical protein N3D75_03250 [Candidatus Aenigmarchaeota archaeon]|nr:hypothetical protein [Candidatus Aenigmarchaeota archaeon]